MNNRPTYKELSNKLKKAIELFENDAIDILRPDVILTDSLELGYSFRNEFRAIIKEVLDQANSDNYTGGRPPQRAYEAEIKGAELFAFVVQIPFLEDKKIYFKFALYKDVLMVVSLHEDRAKEG